MFKKFAMLLAPFVLAPLGLVLTNSAVRAETYSYYWTEWKKCEFSWKDYTWWSARIQVRKSDSAARPYQIAFGNGNSERISRVVAWDSRIINGERLKYPSVTMDSGNKTTWTSPPISLTWISKLYPRYANVQLHNADGRTCTSETRMP